MKTLSAIVLCALCAVATAATPKAATPKATAATPTAAELLASATGVNFPDVGPAVTFAVVSKTLDTLRDPHSMEIDESLVIVKPELLTGCLAFRAKNGFGGYNIGHAVWGFSNKGKLQFAVDKPALWNNLCAGKDADDTTATAKMVLAKINN